MDVRMLQSLTFLLTLLPWSKDSGEVQTPLEGLKKQRNQKLQSVKNSRMYKLSPHSVLSSISGSLSLPALTFVVFLLLIQTSGGDEVISSVRPSFSFNPAPAGDDVASSDWPSVKTTTTPPPPGEHASEKGNEMMAGETEETSKISTTEDNTITHDYSLECDTTPEEDDTFAYDYSLEFDTTPEADPTNSTICVPRKLFYPVIGVIGVLVLALISIIVCVCWRNNHTERAKQSDSAKGLLSSSPEDVTPVPHTYSTTKEKRDADDVSTLSETDKEQKENKKKLQGAQTETAEVIRKLQSQLEEVKRECEEGKMKLQGAQTEAAEVRKELQSQLDEVKRKCNENQTKLDEAEKELKDKKEMTMDKKQKLKGEIEHCLQQKQILKDMYTEKDKVLTQMDKLLQAVDAAAKSMSTHQTV